MIDQIETHILDAIDARVDLANDDELFAGGYLRGHLTLAVAELSQQPIESPEQLDRQVIQSLDHAIQKGELSPPDQRLVSQLWHQLFQQACQEVLLQD